MKKILAKLASIIGEGRLFKILFNLSPMYRRSGGKVLKVSSDLSYVKIRLALNYKTRNYVGTLYGGHMYSCVDGIYMVQLINILGNSFVVWDKSATIKFKRPGDKTLFAEFVISSKIIDQIKTEIKVLNEKDYIFTVNLVDAQGLVYAEVEKVIFIASKDYFKTKKRKKS